MLIAMTEVALLDSTNPWNKASISDDGRFIVYIDKRKMWLKDLATGSTNVVEGPQGMAGDFYSLMLSGDGKKLAFEFFDAQSNIRQIYVKDLHSGVLQVASSNIGGDAGNQSSGWDSTHFYGDGRFLAFTSSASNLVAGPTDNMSHVYLKDLLTGKVTRVTQSSDGADGVFSTREAQVSQDGRYVSFVAIKKDPNIWMGYGHTLVVKDLLTGTVQKVYGGVNGDDYQWNGQTFPVLSAEGSKIAYTTAGKQIYVRDLQSGIATLASADAQGHALQGTITLTSMSADGRYVTFTANDGDQTGAVKYAGESVYQKDMQTGALQLLSIPRGGAVGSFTEMGQSASADGQHIVYYHAKVTPFGNDIESTGYGLNGYPLAVIHTNGLNFSEGQDNVRGTGNADQLAGGNGNDNYWIDHTGDVINETWAAGRDTAYSSVPEYTLPANVENLILVEKSLDNSLPEDIHKGTGNALDNYIVSNYGMHDILSGMEGNDILEARYGCRMNGGSGFDIAIFKEIFSDGDGTVEKVPGGLRVKSSGYESMVVDIERVQMKYTGISFVGDTSAEKAFRIYQAAFNRPADEVGLGFWIKQFDKGAQVADVAQGFTQSAEFQLMYGKNLTHLDTVEKFYQNVLHRVPDDGGLSYWTDILDRHPDSVAHVLAAFSESPENQAALVGVIDAGLTFKIYSS